LDELAKFLGHEYLGEDSANRLLLVADRRIPSIVDLLLLHLNIVAINWIRMHTKYERERELAWWSIGIIRGR